MKFGSFPIALAALALAGPWTWAEPARADGGTFHVTYSRPGYSVVVGGSGVRFVSPGYRDIHDRYDRHDNRWQDRRTQARDSWWQPRRSEAPVRRVYRKGYRAGYDDGYDDGYSQARQDLRDRRRQWQGHQRTRDWYPDSTGQTAGSCTPTMRRRVIVWP